MLSRLTALVILLSLPVQIFAWGREGHHIIALLAESRLDELTKVRIVELLGADTLVNASTWPDEIRKDRDETAGWHYVSIPRGAPFFDEARDCFQPDTKRKGADTDHQNCAVDRIDTFARILADPAQPKSARVEALKFMVHFLSDIHQPMHAMEEGHGGNDIKIVQFGSPDCGPDRLCNLHALWDSGLIEHSEPNEVTYRHRLEVLIAKNELDQWPEGTPRDWANESHVLAEGALLENGGLADQIYFNHEISYVDRRLALAGIRLARLLNSTLGRVDATAKPTPPAVPATH